MKGIRKIFTRSGSADCLSKQASQAPQAAADAAKAACQLNLDLQRQELELKKARVEDALRRDLENLQEAYEKTVQAAKRETKVAQGATAKEGAGAHAAPTAPLTPEREEPACHKALDRDLDREARMKQSPRVLKQIAKNANLSLVSINDSWEPSERLALLLSKSKMLDMELAEAERQFAAYINKFNREFTREMLAHPPEIDGVEIIDGDDASSSSASTMELTKFVRKLMHNLALKMHPDKNPGRDRSDFQLLTKAEKELDLPAMLAMADEERIPVPKVPPAAIQECERRIVEKRSQLREMKISNAWSWGSAGNAPSAKLRERIVASMGLKYVGQLKEGELHGYGNAEWPNGSWYKGQWRNGEFHGMGQYFVPGSEGYLYLGSFRDYMRDGHGVLKYNSGGSFVGELAEGHQKKGIHTLENGDMLEGTFVDGQLTGLGKQIPSSSERASCSGNFVGGRLHGHGTWELKGRKYTGEFREGQPQSRLLGRLKHALAKHYVNRPPQQS